MKLTIPTTLAACVALAVPVDAYQITWSVIAAGGGTASGGGYVLNGTVGQPAAGYVQDGSFLHWIGFWSGESANPQVVDSISALKELPDASYVSVAGKIAASGAADYDGYFYVQEADRSSGIRVAMNLASIPGIARGSVLNVLGTLGTTADGERQIAGRVVIIAGVTAPPVALGMNNKTVGGATVGFPPLGQEGITGVIGGVNNLGLLVKTWGQVISSGAGFVVIDDGSNTPVRVSTEQLASVPGVGHYIIVVGASSLQDVGGNKERLVLPRDSGDISAP